MSFVLLRGPNTKNTSDSPSEAVAEMVQRERERLSSVSNSFGIREVMLVVAGCTKNRLLVKAEASSQMRLGVSHSVGPHAFINAVMS